MIRPAELVDAEAIALIYNDYILHTAISFEEQGMTPHAMGEGMGEVFAASLPWLVAESSWMIAGYAYAAMWNDRSAYRFSVQSTIYLDWAQVNGRNTLTWEEKFKLDVWYVENQSLLLDSKILWMTMAMVFKSDGICQEGMATMEKFRGNSV